MSEIIKRWKQLVSFRAIKIAVSDPLYAYTYAFMGERKVLRLQIRRLIEHIGVDVNNLDDYWQTISAKGDLHAHISKALSGTYYGELAGSEFLYVMVRMLKAEIVVETGVAAGISSALILQALEDNNRGKLYSIDFPNYALIDASPIPEGKQPGFVVPPSLKGRWSLRLGKSRDLLPNLLAEIGKTDIFLHDSEHTYDNMMFEYTTAWDYLPQNGLLLSHDISWNNAFRDFARKVKRKPTEIYFTGVGAIVK